MTDERTPPSQRRPAPSPLDQAQNPRPTPQTTGPASDRESMEAGAAFRQKLSQAGIGSDNDRLTEEQVNEALKLQLDERLGPPLDREELDALLERQIFNAELKTEMRVRAISLRDRQQALDAEEALEKSLKPINVEEFALQGRATQEVPVFGKEMTAVFTTFPGRLAPVIQSAAKSMLASGKWIRPLPGKDEEDKLHATVADKRAAVQQGVDYLIRIGNMACGLSFYGGAPPSPWDSRSIVDEKDREQAEKMVEDCILEWLDRPGLLTERMVDQYERFLYRVAKACNDPALITHAGKGSSSPLPS